MTKFMISFATLAFSLLSTAAFAMPPCFDHGQQLQPSSDRLKQLAASNDNQRHEVLVVGTVTRTLPFDRQGLPHQKFVIDVNGTSVLIVHNLDLAQTVPVQEGAQIAVCGEFLMIGRNSPMIHWTHWDPGHKHGDGFISYNGTTYGLRPGRPASWQ